MCSGAAIPWSDGALPLSEGAARSSAQPHGLAAGPPGPGLALEPPGDCEPAGPAAVVVQVVGAHLVPLALDEHRAARRAPRAAAGGVVHVAGVHVPQAPGARDIEHPEVGMEGGEVP